MRAIHHILATLAYFASTTIAAGIPIGVAYPYGDTMVGDQSLLKGQGLVSENGQYVMVMQNDNNLCIYDPTGGCIFATLTNNYNIDRVIMQTDGNFVMYDTNQVSRWSSGTTRSDGGWFKVNLSNNGTFTIFETNALKTLGHGFSP